MDPLYLIGSIAGIALLVGLNVLLFGRSSAKLDARTAANRLALDVPGFCAGDSLVSADGSALLLENAAEGSLYLAIPRGDGLAIRKLARGTVRALDRDDGKLNLRLDDFTFAGAALDLGDAAAAQRWEARIRRAML